MRTPEFRALQRRLALAALAVAGLVAASPWVRLATVPTPNARGVALSFYPVTVPAVRLNVAVTKDQVEAWGTAGKIKIASAADGVVAFEAPAEVAELQVRAPARTVEVSIPKTAAKPKPPDKSRLKALGEFKTTSYYVPYQPDFAGPDDTDILAKDGSVLARAPAKFVNALHIQGTAKLKDGRIINTCGAKRYTVVEAPWGHGVGYHLIPWKSVAVDRTVIPLGTRLFVPEFVGLKLPDGTLHDGVVYAHDTGGAIKGNRIDIFIGPWSAHDTFAKSGLKGKTALSEVLKEGMKAAGGR